MTNRIIAKLCCSKDIEIIADIIANAHDSDANDLRVELRTILKESKIEIAEALIDGVINSFMNLPPTIRFHRNFDHCTFVLAQFSKAAKD